MTKVNVIIKLLNLAFGIIVSHRRTIVVVITHPLLLTLIL